MALAMIIICSLLWAILPMSMAQPANSFVATLTSVLSGLEDPCAKCAICSNCYTSCSNFESLTNAGYNGCSSFGPPTLSSEFWNCACNTNSAVLNGLSSLASSCARIDIIPTNTVTGFINEVLGGFEKICNVVTSASSGTPAATGGARGGTNSQALAKPTSTGIQSKVNNSGAKAGIAVGTIAGAAAVVVILFLLLGRRRKIKAPESIKDSSYPAETSKARPAPVEEFNPYPGPEDNQ